MKVAWISGGCAILAAILPVYLLASRDPDPDPQPKTSVSYERTTPGSQPDPTSPPMVDAVAQYRQRANALCLSGEAETDRQYPEPAATADPQENLAWAEGVSRRNLEVIARWQALDAPPEIAVGVARAQDLMRTANQKALRALQRPGELDADLLDEANDLMHQSAAAARALGLEGCATVAE